MENQRLNAFPCSQCGLCCRHPNLSKLGLEVDDTGACIHLGPDNRCRIYETRPDVCRVDRMARRQNRLSMQEYYLQNSLVCNELMLEAGAPAHLLIDIEREYGCSPASP